MNRRGNRPDGAAGIACRPSRARLLARRPAALHGGGAGIRTSRAGEYLGGRLARLSRPRTVIALMRRSAAEFRTDHCAQMAAAISFHTLFSLFPLAIAATGVLGLVTQSAHAQDIVTNAVLRAVPLSSHGQQQLRGLLASVGGGAGALGLLGVIGVVWSSSGVMAAVRVALNVAWDTDARRTFVRGKAVDLLLVAGVFVVLAAALGLTIVTSFARRGSEHLPSALRALGPVAADAASAGGVLLAWALLFAVFLVLYRVVPAVRTRVRDVWPGALVAAAGFEVAQWGFSAYLASFAHYNKVYGSLGAIIAFLFFVYLASAVFLLGAEVASEYPRVNRARPAGQGNPPPRDPG